MIRAIILAVGLIASASCAAGQSVPVRSGEHDAYTRLVLKIPEGTGWALSRQKNGARLTVDLKGVVFDTKSVFARLSENRLETVTQAEPGAPLQMDFGCECAAVAFLYKDSMIVVDIAAQQSLPPPSDEIPAPLLTSRPKQRDSGVAKPLDGLAEPLLRLGPQGLQDQLMSRLLQGADRGIVDLKLAPTGPRASGAATLPKVPLDFPAHIGVSSILDELKTGGKSPIQALETLPPCISDAELGFDTWSDGRPFLQQVADLRVGLYQEFDRIAPETALRLAQLLAHFGFGAEARQVLRLSHINSPGGSWVRTIAYILDEQKPSAPNPFDKMQRCDGDIALWAVLADENLQTEADMNRIEHAFLRLPDHLRRHLGPRLADILVGAQELEAARRILRSVDRVESDRTPDTTLAKAEVATAQGDVDTSEILLNHVINDSRAQSEAPLALARLIEKRWKQGGTVTKKQLDLTAAYAVELRDSDLGAVMGRSHAVALSLSNDFDPAFSRLRTHHGDAAWTGTQNRVLQMLAERADDFTFLRHALALNPTQFEGLTADTALLLAKRFADLGFAVQARSLAGLGQGQARNKDRSMVRARAALLDKQPQQALLELEQDDSRSAQRLRAQALTQAGDYAAAADAWHKIGEGDVAVHLSWLAGLPSAHDSLSDERLKQMVELSQTLNAPIPRVPDKPLSDAAGMLADSIETRRQVAELLTLAAELN